jgi:uracil-DNA glycosylase
MDDATRKEIKAWLEFYQDLGIEGFYRRESAAGVVLPDLEAARPAQPAVTPAPKPDPSHAPARVAAPPAPSKPVAFPQPTPPRATVAPDSGHRTPDSGPIIRPLAPSFNLFEAPPAPRSGPETLEQIRQDLGDCRRCKLAPTRKTIVFGEGNPHAELVFVGEGPGADEDEQGLPFVGRAGKLLNRMMQTVGLKREEVYICNIVKCRPPGNRTPEKDEIDSCSPFLYRQIESIKPRLVCCLGAPAARTLLGIKEGITKVRGQFFNFGSTLALATVHPAYVLRNPREEKILREDFEKICDYLKGA